MGARRGFVPGGDGEHRHSGRAEQYALKFTMIQGDATRLPFADGSYEIVYSNSVIEHLGTWENQQAFAREARRVGRRLWIQTPRSVVSDRAASHRTVRSLLFQGHPAPAACAGSPCGAGSRSRPCNQVDATFLAEVRLLTAREMQTLFPDCQILRERLFPV